MIVVSVISVSMLHLYLDYFLNFFPLFCTFQCGGKFSLSFWPQVVQKLDNTAPVVQKVDNAIHQINHYPLDGGIGFPNTYPWDSDLSVG